LEENPPNGLPQIHLAVILQLSGGRVKVKREGASDPGTYLAPDRSKTTMAKNTAKTTKTTKPMAAPAPAAKGGKPAAKKATAPKATATAPAAKKATATAPAATGPKQMPKSQLEGFTGKRAAIVRAMIQMKAVNAANARNAADIAAKAKVEPQDVKHYLYKDGEMAVHGFVAITKMEGSTLLHYYLTAKGAKAKLAE
jgi:hypothetical protein